MHQESHPGRHERPATLASNQDQRQPSAIGQRLRSITSPAGPAPSAPSESGDFVAIRWSVNAHSGDEISRIFATGTRSYCAQQAAAHARLHGKGTASVEVNREEEEPRSEWFPPPPA